MKKILLTILLAGIISQLSAQDADGGIIYGKENEMMPVEKYQLQYTSDKRSTHIYGISGLVLCGSGMATGLFYGGATERDPARYAKCQIKERQEKTLYPQCQPCCGKYPVVCLG